MATNKIKTKLEIEAYISNLKEFQSSLNKVIGGDKQKGAVNTNIKSFLDKWGDFSKLGNLSDIKKFLKDFNSLVKEFPELLKGFSDSLVDSSILQRLNEANKNLQIAWNDFSKLQKELEDSTHSYKKDGETKYHLSAGLKEWNAKNPSKALKSGTNEDISWQRIKSISTKRSALKNEDLAKYEEELARSLSMNEEQYKIFIKNYTDFWAFVAQQQKDFNAQYDAGELAVKNAEVEQINAQQAFSDATNNISENPEIQETNINLKGLIDSTQELNKTVNKIIDENSGNERNNGGIPNNKDDDSISEKEVQNFKDAPKDVNKLSSSVQKQDGVVKKAIKSFFGYQAIIRGLRKVISSAVSAIKEIDSSLTEQAMVTGQTRKSTYKLLNSYQNLAKELGATTTEVSAVATEYMKQGRTIEDALKLTEAAVAAAKVAHISTADSVNYLTTAINGFRLEAEDAMLVSDKFAALAATSATDYNELAIALSKVASQANLAGMSIDYTLGLLAKGIETTKESAESIGTALKTVIARMREMTDYGATLEDGTDVNNVEKQLAYVGIALRNTQGELRSTEEVLDELGRKWDELSANQQAAIAKALAGSRQQSRLISILNDYDRTLELVNASTEAEGATAAQLEVYLTGLDASLNQLKTSWQQFSTTLVNSEFVIGIVNVLTRLVEILSDMPFLITTISILLTTKLVTSILLTVAAHNAEIAAILAKEKVEKKATISRTTELLAAVLTRIGLLKAETVATWYATEQTVTASKVASAAIASIPIVGWIAAAITATVALGVAIWGLCKYFSKQESAATKAAKSIAKLQNEIYNLQKTASAIETATSKFEDLDNQIIKTKEDLEAMKEAADEVRNALTQETLDWFNKKTRSNYTTEQISVMTDVEVINLAEQIKESSYEEITKKREEAVAELKKLSDSFMESYNQMTSEGHEAAAKASINSALILGMGENYSKELQNTILNAVGNLDYDVIAKALDDGINLTDQIADIFSTEITSQGKYFKDIEELMDVGTFKQQEEFYNQLISQYGEESIAIQALLKMYPQLKSFRELELENAGILDKIQNFGVSVKQVNDLGDSIDNINKKYGTSIDTLRVLSSLVNGEDWKNILMNEGLEEGTKQWDAALNSLSKVIDSTQLVFQNVDDLKNSVTFLREQAQKYASGELSADEIYNLVNGKYKDLFANEDFWNAFSEGRDISNFLADYFDESRKTQIEDLEKLRKSAEASGDTATMKAIDKLLADLAEGTFAQLSLEEVIEKQQKALDLYKDFLEEEKDALVDNLEKRRKAFEKYYDKINDAKETEDYETERQRLIDQMNKLVGASDATSLNKVIELQKELTELDKEYEDEKVEKAQESVLDSLDNEIDVIETRYEEIMKNEQAMWDQIQKDGDKFFTKYGEFLLNSGITMEKYLSEMKEVAVILDVKNFDTTVPDITPSNTGTSNNYDNSVTIGGINMGSNSNFKDEILALLKRYGLLNAKQ